MYRLLATSLALLPLALATPGPAQQPISAPSRRTSDHAAESRDPRGLLSPRAVPTLEEWQAEADAQGRKLCYLEADAAGGDDAPAISAALEGECREKGLVVLPSELYHIDTTMNTTRLSEVALHIYGRLLWSDDHEYWRTVSMPMGFQNQSTVWFFGGKDVLWDGHGVGTLDGNGQVWYDWAQSQGNLAHRPMNINYRGLTDSVIRQMRYVQSQMWTMTVSYSQNVLLEDIYVNSTSNSQWNTLNTDGADTWRSDNITFRRWSVTNGDDAIALKGNSSNIAIYDCEFWDSTGIAIGSMGQYEGEYEHIEGLYASNITMHNTIHIVYHKSWPGHRNGYPPNGGGGGLGYARDIVVEDVTADAVRGVPIFGWQCEHYSGGANQDCNSSEFDVSGLHYRRFKGTMKADVDHSGWLKCSGAAGTCDVEITDYSISRVGEEGVYDVFFCENVVPEGFECNAPEELPEGEAAARML